MKTRKLFVIAAPLAVFGFANAAQAQQAGKLFFEGDLVRGNTRQGQTGPTCVLASQFKRGESVVWRMRVHDATGKMLDDKGVKTVVIELSDGQKFPMKFGGHPPRASTDNFWATSWNIPENYPTGTLSYKVIATDAQDQAQTWEPFKIATSQLAVIPGTVEYTRPPAPPQPAQPKQ